MHIIRHNFNTAAFDIRDAEIYAAQMANALVDVQEQQPLLPLNLRYGLPLLPEDKQKT